MFQRAAVTQQDLQEKSRESDSITLESVEVAALDGECPSFKKADLNEVEFRERIQHSKGPKFKKAKLNKVVFVNVDLNCPSFEKAQLNDVLFLNTSKEPNKKSIFMKCANFNGATLNEVEANDAWLLYIQCIGVRLTKVQLKSSDMCESNFSQATIIDCQFTSSDLRATNFANAKISGSSFVNADLKNVEYRVANFTNAECFNSDFSYANMARANLEGANFTGSTLVGANLRNANLKKARLEQAHFFPRVEDLDEAALFGILNRYELLYLSSDWIDPNIKLLKKLIREDLKKKIKAVYFKYGYIEAARLCDIAIQHPFFATRRSDYKIDKKKPTTSQKYLMRLKAVINTLEINKEDRIILDQPVKRSYTINKDYFYKLSKLNSQQLSQLVASPQLQMDKLVLKFEHGDYPNVWEALSCSARELNEGAIEAIKAAIHTCRKEFGESLEGGALLNSLVIRLLSLREDKTELIKRLCQPAPCTWSRTRINAPSHPAAYSNLRGTDLTGYDLGAADLRYANLNEAILIRANLSKAILDDAKLERCQFFPQENLQAELPGLLEYYASIYLGSSNLKVLKPAMMHDLLAKLADSDMEPSEIADLLQAARMHPLFAEHQNKLTRAANTVFSFFARTQVIYTATQRTLARKEKFMRGLAIVSG